MMKKGFTLAEVLITLSIIGVVSALTLPNLSSGYSRQVTATQLSKAINTLENAAQVTLINEGLTDFPKNCILQDISNNLKGVYTAQADSNFKPQYKDYKNGSSSSGLSWYMIGPNSSQFLVTKDGMTFSHVWTDFDSLSATVIDSLPNMYSGSYDNIYVDINGHTKKPNVLGKDLFLLHVDTYGTVIPHGGTQWASYIKPDNPDPPLWQTECTKATVSANDGAACAGAIVDNGYVVNYF